jgi:hypothetical protein
VQPHPRLSALHHLNRDQFEDVLRRARTAVAASGALGFTVKEGDDGASRSTANPCPANQSAAA